jgi:hypothetical protein
MDSYYQKLSPNQKEHFTYGKRQDHHKVVLIRHVDDFISFTRHVDDFISFTRHVDDFISFTRHVDDFISFTRHADDFDPISPKSKRTFYLWKKAGSSQSSSNIYKIFTLTRQIDLSLVIISIT